jgi:RNA polymerase sigma-70 factor (ECF subfamily)
MALRPRSRQHYRDEALIRALYDEHGSALLAYATRLAGSRQAGEDVTQETLVRAWKHAEVLTNGKGSVRAWLFTVARNIVTDGLRARAARPVEVAERQERDLVEQDHSDGVVANLVMREALETLSEPHREVLVELYFHGRTMAEAALALGVPRGTVKSRAFYALHALRELFGEPTAMLCGMAG